jgi:ABC-2 type transport system permease protein
MKRYIAYSKIGLKQQLVYKGDLWLNVFGMLVVFVLWIFFWKALYQGREVVDSVSMNQMIAYMVISYAVLIPQLHNMRIRHAFTEKIRSGDIIFDLMKPVHFVWRIFFERIGTMCMFFFLIVLPIYGGILFISTGYLPNIKVILSFFAAVVISLAIGFLINVNFCLLMMKYVETSGTWVLLNALTFFLGGMPFPIWIYPESVQSIIEVLPFQFMYYVPTGIFNGVIPEEAIAMQLVTGAMWVVILTGINVVLWRVMLRNLMVQGG